MQITKRQFRTAVLLFIFFMGFWFLWLVRAGLYPFFIGIFLAYLLNPFVAFGERKGLTRMWSLVIVYLVVFSSLIGVGSKLIPLLIKELESFANELPRMSDRAELLLYEWQHNYQNWVLPNSMRLALDEGINHIATNINIFIQQLVQGILGLFTYVIGLAVSPILAFYILYDWKAIKEKIIFFVPSAWRAELLSMLKNINQVLDGVIRGQIFTSLLVGMIITVGLFILGIKYALLIGILAGILDIIPYFGAVIGALPALGVALIYSPVLLLKVLFLFFVVHQLESAVIQPKIVGNTVGLHPLSVIFFVFIGGELAGLPGMLLGVPIAAIVKLFIQHAFKLLV